MEYSQEPEAKKEVIAILWMTLGESVIRASMKLWKLIRETEVWPEFEEPAVSYRVELVPGDKYDAAWEWVRRSGWKGWGVWHREHPGLAFSPDVDEVIRAFEILADGGRDRNVRDVLWRAPVRYSRRETSGAYPYIRSTRSRSELWRLRSRYPNAGELAWLPGEVLYQRFGDGIQFGYRM